MLMFCVIQLRRMQEMIAKMQLQMQKQGDGEEVWKVYGEKPTTSTQNKCLFNLQHLNMIHYLYLLSVLILHNLVRWYCNLLFSVAGISGTAWVWPERNWWQQQRCWIWLLTHTACHYLHSVPRGMWSHFFIHTVYSSVLYLNIYTHSCIAYTFFYYFFSFDSTFASYSNEEISPIYVTGIIYILIQIIGISCYSSIFH